MGLSSEPTTLTPGHAGAVYSVAFRQGDGDTLASGSEDKTIKLWKVRSDKPLLHTFHVDAGEFAKILSVAFSPMHLNTLASGVWRALSQGQINWA
jgi:WD40 repeat protein